LSLILGYQPQVIKKIDLDQSSNLKCLHPHCNALFHDFLDLVFVLLKCYALSVPANLLESMPFDRTKKQKIFHLIYLEKTNRNKFWDYLATFNTKNVACENPSIPYIAN